MMQTRRDFLTTATALGMAPNLAADNRFDVAVYGATPAGIMAAVSAGRAGKRVVLLEPGRHAGGMTSGGLGATDSGNKAAIGGLAREFHRRIKAFYAESAPAEDTMWTFEPHVAERVLLDMLRDAHVETIFGQRLDLRHGVDMRGRRIGAIVMESGRRFEAAVFIDATYEGDLMAKSGVKYIVGRESNSVYGERYNGARRRMWDHANGGEFGAHFPRAVDPFIRPGDRSSGLLFGVQEETIPEDGTGDRRVQAYMFRLCLTDVPENQAPFRKPPGYDPRRYELLLRLLLSEKRFDELPGLPDPDHPVLGMNTTAKLMPNRKTDLNTKGGAGADYVGGNWDYPEASHEKRDRIWKDHIEYQQGLIWFVATDPRVPERYRLPMKSWGYAADEFPDTDHWPHQLYIREARRMIGEYVMTEHTCQGQDTPADAIGLASYAIDSHMTSRYVDEKGRVQNEGHILTSGLKPYPVSYRAITPKAAECENLLVPVCLSASHTAYGSIRMEPVFMILGESAGTAAVLAVDRHLSVQQVPYPELRERLLKGKQQLSWG